MKQTALALAVALVLMPVAQSSAQNVDPPAVAEVIGFAQIRTMPIPVIAGDITDHPYRVLGVVEAEVRRATLFSRNPSQAKVYRELWERAAKLKADAVVNARYGDARVTALSWGSRRAEGQAIKFLTDDEIAALPARAAAPAVAPR
jgi:uncharacterized protein YbjQ (UPF0145 family)